MAAIDLEDLVPDLINEISAPGATSYATVSSEEWVGRLRNAFWDAQLQGLLDGWSESDGLIFDPANSDNTMGRDLQQVIILNASIKSIINEMRSATKLRTKAGPVEYEHDSSANVLRAVLESLQAKMNRILDNLQRGGRFTGIRYIDSYRASQNAIADGAKDWVGSI